MYTKEELIKTNRKHAIIKMDISIQNKTGEKFIDGSLAIVTLDITEYLRSDDKDYVMEKWMKTYKKILEDIVYRQKDN